MTVFDYIIAFIVVMGIGFFIIYIFDRHAEFMSGNGDYQHYDDMSDKEYAEYIDRMEKDKDQ